jgi:AcrR family transcriptional regulator
MAAGGDGSGIERLPSGRHGLDRESVVSSQRSRLIQAMIDSVAEKGFADTTVADVTGRAGVSRATFYELFDDKRACFFAAHDQLIGAVVSRFTGGYDAPERWPDRIRSGLEILLGVLADNPDDVRVAVVEVIAAGPEGAERFHKITDMFVPFIEQGREDTPDGREVPPHVPRMVVGGIIALIVEETRAGAAADLRRLLPELTYAALVPFVGHEAARLESSTTG